MIRHFLRALPFAILVGVFFGVETRMGRNDEGTFGSTPAASMLERLSALKDSSVGHGVKSQTPSLAVRPPLGTRQWDANNDQLSLITRA